MTKIIVRSKHGKNFLEKFKKEGLTRFNFDLW